ncbi:conserved hypothetical protein [Vibrio chagasii]|nr:conserved hypothetical protein [Vibrio chagasii]
MFERKRILFLIKRALLTIFLSPLLLISFLFPRRKDIWVVGGFSGQYSDSAKEFFEYLSSDKVIEVVWITNNKEVYNSIVSKGYNACMKWSLRGMYLCLRAGLYIYSSHISDVNFWLSCGVKSVNLWHGIPLKKVEFDIDIGDMRFVYNPINALESIVGRLTYPAIKRGHDLVLSSSIYEDSIYQSTFKCKMINSLSPRNIKLINSNNIKHKPERVLYAPTFRSDYSSIVREHEISVIKALSRFCRGNDLQLCLSLHPSSQMDIGELTDVDLTIVNGNAICDDISKYGLLVTDFSSIAFDFEILNKKVIYTAVDFDDYLKKERAFYPSAHSFLEDNLIETISELESELLETYVEREKIIELKYDSIRCLDSLKDKLVKQL